MKIGILTFHCAHNYGAVLQTYALQEYLKSCGNEVEVIDYRPRYLTASYDVFPLPNLRDVSLKRKILRLCWWGLHLPQSILTLPLKIKRWRGFDKFISEKLNLSRERFFDAGVVSANQYDAIVFGSDQIWSIAHTRGGDPVFLGDFSVPAGTLKVAYAASAGASSAILGENPMFVEALKNFDAISVREENLAASLQPKTDKKIETVLDPTLLVDKSVWDKIALRPKINKKYVLVYRMLSSRGVMRVAKDLAKQLDATVIDLSSPSVKFAGRKMCETPEAFAGWFKHAACVVTTSFHGTAFSILNKTPFYFVGTGHAAENRPRQILKVFGYDERYVKEGSTVRFSPLRENLNENGGGYAQTHSRAFLARALRRP